MPNDREHICLNQSRMVKVEADQKNLESKFDKTELRNHELFEKLFDKIDAVGKTFSDKIDEVVKELGQKVDDRPSWRVVSFISIIVGVVLTSAVTAIVMLAMR